MNQFAQAALRDVNVIVWVVSALKWQDDDEFILKRLKNCNVPIILAVNKIDKVKDRKLLLPYIELLSRKIHCRHIVPVAALTGLDVSRLEQMIIDLLPNDLHYFPPEQFTDRSDRFIAAEIIREKLMRYLGQEIPYATTVVIDQLTVLPEIVKIAAVVFVEKAGQKAIVIGKKGAKLKVVASKARLDLERWFQQKVYLNIWVKIKPGWSDDEQLLRQLGYHDD